MGTYTDVITCAPGTLATGNYTFATGSLGDLEITQRTLVVTPHDGQNKVYGDVDPTLTYTHGPLFNGDTDSVFTGALARAAGENVGTYAINQGTLSAGLNYAISFTTGKTFEITPKPITITPTSGQSKVYGTADPTLTFTGSSALVAGDSYTGGLARAAGNNVGNLPDQPRHPVGRHQLHAHPVGHAGLLRDHAQAHHDHADQRSEQGLRPPPIRP